MLRLFSVFVVVLAILFAPNPASAQDICEVGAFRQFDMAGVYVSPESAMRLEMYPCGGNHLQWDNEYGRHRANYYSVTRIPDGGIVARGIHPDQMSGGYLDGADAIGFKPAEPGFIQVVTVDPYGRGGRVYRFQKIR